jgi:hypothetical protein
MEKRQNESCKDKNKKANTEFAKEICPKDKKENKK